ncbi:MAG: hypothetical protein AB7O26_16070 [Planctomycetaceae bacterium]
MDELKVRVMRGELRRTDQVSVDRRSWMSVEEFEPELFEKKSDDQLNSFWAALQEGGHKTYLYLKERSRTAWRYVRDVAEFYWSNRRSLWQLFTEYAPFFREHGNRREIRVSQNDNHDKVHFDGDQWHVELPDCCVVCGEPAARDWNSEQRSVPDLTWPLLAPINGMLLGILIAIFLWNEWSRWFIPFGLIAGFIVGYRLKGEIPVTIRFRRCREHLNRISIPRLRTYRNVLVIGVGDRAVWRQFHYGKSDIETPQIPPPLPDGPSYTPQDVTERHEPPRTIKLVDDDDDYDDVVPID